MRATVAVLQELGACRGTSLQRGKFFVAVCNSWPSLPQRYAFLWVKCMKRNVCGQSGMLFKRGDAPVCSLGIVVTCRDYRLRAFKSLIEDTISCVIVIHFIIRGWKSIVHEIDPSSPFDMMFKKLPKVQARQSMAAKEDATLHPMFPQHHSSTAWSPGWQCGPSCPW